MNAVVSAYRCDEAESTNMNKMYNTYEHTSVSNSQYWHLQIANDFAACRLVLNVGLPYMFTTLFYFITYTINQTSNKYVMLIDLKQQNSKSKYIADGIWCVLFSIQYC